MPAQARLAIEYQPGGSEKPTSVGVFVGEELVAWVTLEEFDKATNQLTAMRKRAIAKTRDAK